MSRGSVWVQALVAAFWMPAISGTGMAQCNGIVGVVTIEATAPMDPSMPLTQMNSMMSVVTGRANLTCP
jgi:hypothetical protein